MSPLAIVLLAFAAVAAGLVALGRYRDRQAARARAVRLDGLYDAVRAISLLDQEEELFPELCRRVVASGNASLACIYQLQGEQAVRVAGAGPVDTVLENVPVALGLNHPDMRASYTAGVLRSGVGVVSNDYALDSRAGHWRKEAVAHGVRAICWIPIRRHAVPAVLMLCATERDFFDDERRHIMELLCKTASTAPHVVLVHGAFANGSSWSCVMPLLVRKGYRVTAVELPLTSLAADVAATRRAIESQGGDVVLVGHGWGGVVVTEAGNEPAVKQLVYLSALVPDSGESAGAVIHRYKAPMDGIRTDEAGYYSLGDSELFRQVMATDLPPDRAQALAAMQRPIAARAFDDVVSHAAWRDKPSWYLIAGNDLALPPRVQRQIAAHVKATTLEFMSGHLSMASHPAAVADLIDLAARGRVPGQGQGQGQ